MKIERPRTRDIIKRRYQYYSYESVRNALSIEGKNTTGKESASEFVWLCGMVVLGKLGYKFGDILTDEDKAKIKKLHRRITACG